MNNYPIDEPFLHSKFWQARHFLRELQSGEKNKNKVTLSEGSDYELSTLCLIINLLANHVIPISASNGEKLMKSKKISAIKEFKTAKKLNSILKLKRKEKLQKLAIFTGYFKYLLKDMISDRKRKQGK